MHYAIVFDMWHADIEERNGPIPDDCPKNRHGEPLLLYNTREEAEAYKRVHDREYWSYFK